MSTTRFDRGQTVSVSGDVFGGVSGKLPPIPDGETVTVFEDFGQVAISVRRANGQIRVVDRSAVRP